MVASPCSTLGATTLPPDALFDDRPISLLKRDNEEWLALVGIPLGQRGMQELLVNNKVLRFLVGEREAGRSDIELPPGRYTEPLKENDKLRITTEQVRINATRASFAGKLPLLPLRLPAQGIISTPFGFKRYINGRLRSSHRGLDIAAPEGTPVFAAAAGRVALARNLFYTGNTIILIHGNGLTTLYAHLSTINVGEGTQVERGHIIGQVGSTGRSTGDHLHWGASLNGALIDPALLLSPQSIEDISGRRAQPPG